jgi:acyl-CoA thioesterase
VKNEDPTVFATGCILGSEGQANRQTKKIAVYEIKITGQDDSLIATCQALAYRTGKAIPFLET